MIPSARPVAGIIDGHSVKINSVTATNDGYSIRVSASDHAAAQALREAWTTNTPVRYSGGLGGGARLKEAYAQIDGTMLETGPDDEWTYYADLRIRVVRAFA
jgi:hypothetical protein